MSVINVIYGLLSKDDDLTSMLSKSVISGAEDKPAIYDTYPGQEAAMPYVLCDWYFPPSNNHWAQVNATLNVNVYVDNADTVTAEKIKERIAIILSWRMVRTETEGNIRIYPGNSDGIIPDEEPHVIHWNIDFEVKFWRQRLIQAVNSDN